MTQRFPEAVDSYGNKWSAFGVFDIDAPDRWERWLGRSVYLCIEKRWLKPDSSGILPYHFALTLWRGGTAVPCAVVALSTSDGEPGWRQMADAAQRKANELKLLEELSK